MATKSIYKNVNIKEKNLSRTLVSALENAKNKSCKTVQMQKSVKDIRGEKIKELFDGKCLLRVEVYF